MILRILVPIVILMLLVTPISGAIVQAQQSITVYMPMVQLGGETVPGAVTQVVSVGPGLTFSPALGEIQAGDVVRWEWAEAFHTVNSGVNGVSDGLFCSPDDQNCDNNPASPMGAVYEKQFNTPGTFPYFCRIHPGMEGEIVVQP